LIRIRNLTPPDTDHERVGQEVFLTALRSLKATRCIAVPNTGPSSGITSHDPDPASSDRAILDAVRFRIAVRVRLAYLSVWPTGRCGLHGVPGHAMKLDHAVGSIEVGTRADLILVAGRSDRLLSDIRNP
jgi:hypothetical protein